MSTTSQDVLIYVGFLIVVLLAIYFAYLAATEPDEGEGTEFEQAMERWSTMQRDHKS